MSASFPGRGRAGEFNPVGKESIMPSNKASIKSWTPKHE